MKKTESKAKLKKKDHGNYFDEEEEMMKNFKTTLKRTRKRKTVLAVTKANMKIKSKNVKRVRAE